MTRFERHPKITLAIVLLVAAFGLATALEWILAPPADKTSPGEATSTVSPIRSLMVREWLPNTRYSFRAPDARRNDPNGPVDDIYALEIDANGFIEPSIRHKDPDFEIVFLGGSTTECLYVRPKIRFPYLAGELLEAKTGKRINAINAGKSGNHAMHSVLNTVAKVLPRRPRYAIMMQVANDVGWLSGKGTYWTSDPDVGIVRERDRSIAQWLRDVRDATFPHSYRAIKKAVIVLRAKLSSSNGPQAPAAREPEKPSARKKARQARPPSEQEIERRKQLREFFVPALRSFVRMSDAWGVKPVLMTQVVERTGEKTGGAGDFLAPERLKDGDFDFQSFSSIHAYGNALVRHVAQTEGAMLIDLVRARKWTDADVYDGLHFTETGSRHVAEIVANAIATDLDRSAKSE